MRFDFLSRLKSDVKLKVMDVEALQNQYIGYHSQNITDESKEKGLERISKEFLSTVEPGDRFAQGVDFYEDIVRISQYFDEHEDFYKMVKAGINSLEKYGLNLWKFPWRKEYHTVKVPCMVIGDCL